MAEPQHSAGVPLHTVPAVTSTPHAAVWKEEGKEVTVNAIMPFSVLALLWVVLTVGAAIAGGISHLFAK
jgi:hypothetical protein